MKKQKYQAVLFHPSGDYVTDFSGDSKDEIWERIADMGSRWIFYPLVFIGTDKTIVCAMQEFAHLKGRRIKTASKYFSETWEINAEQICEVINEGLPLNLVY